MKYPEAQDPRWIKYEGYDYIKGEDLSEILVPGSFVKTLDGKIYLVGDVNRNLGFAGNELTCDLYYWWEPEDGPEMPNSVVEYLLPDTEN